MNNFLEKWFMFMALISLTLGVMMLIAIFIGVATCGGIQALLTNNLICN